jgi:hypothetical protein
MNLSLFLQVSWMFLVPLVAVIIPVLVGERLGIYHRLSEHEIQHTPIASVVSAAFGLLAFMLAFTFQIAANRYDARKAMLIEEVKNVRILYLRAGLIPEPYKSATRKHLTKYVDLRVDLLKDISKIDYTFLNSRTILDSLWSYTEALAAVDRSSEVYALYTSSVNDVIDAYYERVTLVIVYRIPKAILSVLFIIGILSMFALGYQFGVTGKGSFGINVLLATTFSVVMCLIFALDRPETGLVPMNQRPLMILYEQMHAKESKSVSTNLKTK